MEKVIYLKEKIKMFKNKLIIFNVLNFGDWLSTELNFIKTPIREMEANPLWRLLLGTYWMFIIKIGILLTLTFFFNNFNISF